jgi:uncharacterized membrane protein YgaE (UPF0421/DUF939 family)
MCRTPTTGPGGAGVRSDRPRPAVDVRWLRRLANSGCDAWRRIRSNAWPMLQCTGAATGSWLIAQHVVHHHQPFFAPIAAVVALNTPRGERGSNAVRLLLGVVVGIVVAELAIVVFGGGYAALAAATFMAMTIALALNSERIVIAQAAASAILAVATGKAEAGPERLVDALIGAGVALLVSQILFPVEPVALLRRAEAAALADLADGLDLTWRALEHDDDALAGRAVDRLRDACNRLTDLSDTRDRSSRVAHRVPMWWRRVALTTRESESAGQLDLLGNSCLTLARVAAAADTDVRTQLAAPVRQLADALGALAKAPGDRDTRQHAIEQALSIVRQRADSPRADSPLIAADTITRILTLDLLVFAGVDTERVAAVIHETGTVHVPAPSPAIRTPFTRNRRRSSR